MYVKPKKEGDTIVEIMRIQFCLTNKNERRIVLKTRHVVAFLLAITLVITFALGALAASPKCPTCGGYNTVRNRLVEYHYVRTDERWNADCGHPGGHYQYKDIFIQTDEYKCYVCNKYFNYSFYEPTQWFCALGK
jgi:transposase-like protein